MSSGVSHRLGSDPTLLWIWRRLASTALIRHLPWEPPYVVGTAQEMAKKTKKDKKRKCQTNSKRYSTKYLTNTHQKCQSYKRQGNEFEQKKETVVDKDVQKLNAMWDSGLVSGTVKG